MVAYAGRSPVGSRIKHGSTPGQLLDLLEHILAAFDKKESRDGRTYARQTATVRCLHNHGLLRQVAFNTLNVSQLGFDGKDFVVKDFQRIP